MKTSGELECITVDFDTLEGLYAPLNSSGVSALSTQRLRELSDALGFTVVMYCDRHGAEKRLAENERAAELTGYDVIFGNTVVCSFSKDYAPFTAEQLDIICSYFDV